MAGHHRRINKRIRDAPQEKRHQTSREHRRIPHSSDAQPPDDHEAREAVEHEREEKQKVDDRSGCTLSRGIREITKPHAKRRKERLGAGSCLSECGDAAGTGNRSFSTELSRDFIKLRNEFPVLSGIGVVQIGAEPDGLSTAKQGRLRILRNENHGLYSVVSCHSAGICRGMHDALNLHIGRGIEFFNELRRPA